MFREGFSHYLSYGATDQKTVSNLVGQYDGILVPGTVAAYQREGTGGFVLTLSATGSSSPSYVIDPRFPLFQQALPKSKRSHEALAELLGDPSLVSNIEPQPDVFTANRIAAIASAWVDFNLSYQNAQSGKFSKYAKRLGRELDSDDASGPQRILAPYFCVEGTSDPWWQIGSQLYAQTLEECAGRVSCTQVLACESAEVLAELLADVPTGSEVAIWLSGLNELTASSAMLAAYGTAIRDNHSERRCFALYGGFFAVLLSGVGLSGCSHGIGYGEFREWMELPRSGPPPARYYLPTVHRYAQQEEAQRLWIHDPKLVVLDGEDASVPPITLEYHELMLHSVRCRAKEIQRFGGQSTEDSARVVAEERDSFRSRLAAGEPTDVLVRSGMRLVSHLDVWVEALNALNNHRA